MAASADALGGTFVLLIRIHRQSIFVKQTFCKQEEKTMKNMKRKKSKRELRESGYSVDRYGDNTPNHRLGGLVYTKPYWYDCDNNSNKHSRTSRRTKNKTKNKKRKGKK